MPRRPRINWPLWIGLASFLTAIGLYIVAPAVITGLEGERFATANDPWDLIRQRSVTAISGLWFFVLGATIGSFLNVVAYRMPMGLTIVAKPSRCPYCLTPIRFRHNVPLWGWVALRGRCHACHLPIAVRYPLVELAVGILFFTLFCTELASGGKNLPVRPPNSRSGVMWNLLTPQWDLIGIYFFHAFLLSVLATIALIKFDRLAIPRRLVLFTLAVGLGCQLFWPHLNPVPAWFDNSDPWTALHRVGDPLAGLAVGTIVGASVQLLHGLAGGKHRRGDWVIYAVVGLFLGWQTVVSVLVVTSLLQFVVALGGRQCGRPTARLGAANALLGTWLVVCGWRQLPLVWLPGAESSTWTLVGGLALGLATTCVNQCLVHTRPEFDQ